MIDQGTIDRIMAAADIVGVVSEYVSLRRSGASYVGLCPFHDDKHPSFSVSPARGVCKCFSCGKGGNVVHFVMEVEQIGYQDALRKLAKKYGIEIADRQLTDDERRSQSERESMFALNEWACQYFHKTLLEHADGRAVGLAYFRSRGFRDDMIERFRLGYCLDQWDACSQEAQRRGYKREYLTATGLSTQRDNSSLLDKFRGRAIFPWLNVSGKVVGFGGRVLDQRTKGVTQKYVNSPDSPIFHKSQELYGIFQAKKQIAKEDHVYMVEGYTDVISMHQCGVENVVANSGTALNVAQIRLLRRFTQNITLIYDGDEAGIHAALRGTDMLLAEGMNVRVLLLPEGNDPDSFARQHSATEFRTYVQEHATDFILFKASLAKPADTADPRKRSELASNILQSICVIPDEIARSAYVHQCASQLHMDEAMLLRTCNKLRKEFLDKRRQEREIERARKERQEKIEAGGSQEGQGNKAEQEREEAQAGGKQQGAQAPVTQPTATASNEAAGSQVSSPSQQVAETPSTPPAIPSPKVSPAPENPSKIVQLERLILQEVVRYGDVPIATLDAEGNEMQIALAQYVTDDLSMDGITLSHPLYARMLSLWQECPDTDFGHFLLTYPDADISLGASDLLTDRYQLSRIYAPPPAADAKPDTPSPAPPDPRETASQRIVHLIYDYKFAYMDQLIDALRSQLAQTPPDSRQLMPILQEINRITQLRRTLGEKLGEKIM